MKLRRMMAIVAVLAVLTWLVVPAVRIWRDPRLLKHSHAFVSKVGEGPIAFQLGGGRVEADNIVITHDLSFWKAYRTTLLNPGGSGSVACPELAKIVSATRPVANLIQPATLTPPTDLQPPPRVP